MRVHRIGRAAVRIRTGDITIAINDDLYLGDCGLYVQRGDETFYLIPFERIERVVRHDEGLSLKTSEDVEVEVRGRNTILLSSVAHLLMPYVCAEVGC